MIEENSEKITINISFVDLGKIDYLVKQGFYGNRTDFLRAAIKREINSHEGWLDREFIAKNIDIGIIRLSKDDLSEKKLQDLVVLGMLAIDDNITLDDLKAVYRKIIVFGKVKCSQKIKDYYSL